MNHSSDSLPPNSTSRQTADQRHPSDNPPPAPGPEPGAVPASASAADSAVDRFRRDVAGKQGGANDPETEQSLWEGGYSASAMGGAWLSAALATIVLLVVSQLYDTLSLLIALAVAAAIWIVVGLVYMARRLGIQYELTTQRFIHQHGIFSRRTERIEVIDIDDVSFAQGPIQRMLGIGTIDITSSDRSHPHLVMPGIAEVKKVAGLIDDVRRRERTRRSLHIRSM